MSETQPRRSRARTLFLVFFSNTVGLTVVLLLLEVALRIHNPLEGTVRGRQINLPRNKTYVHENTSNPKVDRKVVLRHNELGFLGPAPGEDFEDKLSIVAVGGSTTHCLHLAEGHTWPDVLSQKLSESFPKVWVNNAGIDGHSTFGHLILVDQVIRELRPDVILYLVGINDLARGGLNEFDEELTQGSLLTVAAQYSRVLSTAQTLLRTWRAYDVGVNHHPDLDFAKERPALGVDLEARLKTHREQYIDGYRDRLEKLVKVTREIGALPVLVTQPSLFGNYEDPSTGVQMGKQECDLWDMSAAQAQPLMEMYNEVTRQVANDKGVTLVDLDRQLPKDTKYYFDFIHYSLDGAEFVGTAVAEGITPALRAELSPTAPHVPAP